MASRKQHAARPGRESLSKRLGARVTRAIWRRDNCACAYCGTALVPGNGAHLDHLTPHVAGGEDVPANLVLACRSCNSAKQDMTLGAWAVYANATYALNFNPRTVRAQARRALSM